MDEIKVTVRLPRAVYEGVKRRAVSARRSLNGEIVVMLEEGMRGDVRGCDRCGSVEGPWYQQWLVGDTAGVHDRAGEWLCGRCMRAEGEEG